MLQHSYFISLGSRSFVLEALGDIRVGVLRKPVDFYVFALCAVIRVEQKNL